MTQKQSKIFEFIFLLSLLEEAQICMDEVQDSPLYRQSLKNALNTLQKHLDALFESPLAMNFYIKEGGGSGTEKIREMIHDIKVQFFKQIHNA